MGELTPSSRSDAVELLSLRQRLPLSGQVADEIRRAILELRLPPKRRLIEAKLAAQMNVSRTTIRDALRQLEREGLVSVLPWRATHVIGLTEQEVSEVASLRATLEAFAVELAIPHLTSEAGNVLDRHIARMKAEAQAGNLTAINEADYQFHRAIWELAGHRRLLESLESLSSTILALISISNSVYPTLEGIAQEHQKILRAIRGRRVDAAKKLLHAHAIRFGESVLQWIRQRAPNDGAKAEK